jgi:hypothetical protein
MSKKIFAVRWRFRCSRRRRFRVEGSGEDLICSASLFVLPRIVFIITYSKKKKENI